MSQNRILGYRAKTRSKILIDTATVGAMLIVLSAIQVSVFARLKPFGAVPDLMLCCVLCISCFLGKYAGAITGISAGFLIEAIGSNGISFLPVVYLLYGYVSGHFFRTVHSGRWMTYLLHLACGLLLRAVTTVVYTYATYRTVRFSEVLLHSVLPEMAVTAVAGLLLYVPLGAICRLLERKNKQ